MAVRDKETGVKTNYYVAVIAAAMPIYTQGDSDVISFRIYASWFSPPSCG